MIRLSALILTASLTFGAATPLLCELGCLSETNQSQAQACHDTAAGLGLSAGSASCVHAVLDASVAAVKVTLGQQLAYTLLGDVTQTHRAPSLLADHAHRPRGVTAQPRSVSRTILRI